MGQRFVLSLKFEFPTSEYCMHMSSFGKFSIHYHLTTLHECVQTGNLVGGSLQYQADGLWPYGRILRAHCNLFEHIVYMSLNCYQGWWLSMCLALPWAVWNQGPPFRGQNGGLQTFVVIFHCHLKTVCLSLWTTIQASRDDNTTTIGLLYCLTLNCAHANHMKLM